MTETGLALRTVAAVLGLAAFAQAPNAHAQTQAALQEKVGVDSAVNPNAQGTPPRAVARRIELGQDIVHEERVVTETDGQAQILFLDQSALTVGPNTDLTIDNFVYNPNASTGQLAMSATRGVMRFVGGKISKLENAVTMDTPSASLGIRGGVFLLSLQPNGLLEVVFLYGKSLTVTANGVTQTLTHPGWAIIVAAPGSPPSQPFPAPDNLIASILAQLSGEIGRSGGTSNPPTNSIFGNSGISMVISGDVITSNRQAFNNSPKYPSPPVAEVGELQTIFQVNSATLQPIEQALLSSNPNSVFTPVPPPQTPIPLQPPTITFPTRGVGAFDGVATGSVFNNGATYQATGSFNQIYNFGTNTGTIGIGNFDGANYGFNVNGSGANFSGGLVAGPGNRTGNVAGSFSGAGATQTGGNFGIQSTAGPAYAVSGAFSGH